MGWLLFSCAGRTYAAGHAPPGLTASGLATLAPADPAGGGAAGFCNRDRQESLNLMNNILRIRTGCNTGCNPEGSSLKRSSRPRAARTRHSSPVLPPRHARHTPAPPVAPCRAPLRISGACASARGGGSGAHHARRRLRKQRRSCCCRRRHSRRPPPNPSALRVRAVLPNEGLLRVVERVVQRVFQGVHCRLRAEPQL